MLQQPVEEVGTVPPMHVAVRSALLDEDVRSVVVPPPASWPGRLPWLYLLHGRGGTLEAMSPLVAALEKAMDEGGLDRQVVVVPDGPWSDRASWWVDSAYTGDGVRATAGPAVESAVLLELMPALEARWGPASNRTIGGISMGAAGALRWALVHPGLFGAAVLLSPAVYASEPTSRSSARTTTAFGNGAAPYDHRRWMDLVHYPTLLSRRGPDAPALRVVTVTGDGEPAQDDADGTWTDIDLEAARLHAALKRAPGVDSSLRIVAGGHSWDLWEREVVEAVRRARIPSPLDR